MKLHENFIHKRFRNTIDQLKPDKVIFCAMAGVE